MSGHEGSCCGMNDKTTNQPSTEKSAHVGVSASSPHDVQEAAAADSSRPSLIRTVRRLFGRAAG